MIGLVLTRIVHGSELVVREDGIEVVNRVDFVGRGRCVPFGFLEPALTARVEVRFRLVEGEGDGHG